jgi:hypothetical protein
MLTRLYVPLIGVLAILLGASVAWNVQLTKRVREFPETRARAIIASSHEMLRRTGTIAENDVAGRTLTVEYEGESGEKKRIRVRVPEALSIQRTRLSADQDGALASMQVETVTQASLAIGEPAYVVAAVTTGQERFTASVVMVGDLLPR